MTTGRSAPASRASSASQCTSSSAIRGRPSSKRAVSDIGLGTVLSGDQGWHVGKRRQRHEYRHQMTPAVQFGHQAGLKLADAILVDQMIADETLVGAVV